MKKDEVSFCQEISDIVNKSINKEKNQAQMAFILLIHACLLARACNGEEEWKEVIKNILESCIKTASDMKFNEVFKFVHDPTSSSES